MVKSPEKAIPIEDLNIEIFADGADIEGIISLNKNPIIKGFTTNPTLMRASGITDYEEFAKEVLANIKDKSISFEVFADDEENIKKQARKIASWQDNIAVKIPIMNTKGEFSDKIIEELSYDQIPLNVTAIMTIDQTKKLLDVLNPDCESIISIFAGRIADTGLDPENTMVEAKELLNDYTKAKLLWASPREVLNIYQAEKCKCDIITVPHAILGKLSNINKDLNDFSKETVQMFYDDATKSGFNIET